MPPGEEEPSHGSLIRAKALLIQPETPLISCVPRCSKVLHDFLHRASINSSWHGWPALLGSPGIRQEIILYRWQKITNYVLMSCP